MLNKVKFFFIVFTIIYISASCTSEPVDENINKSQGEFTEINKEKLKKIFYSMPSPLELSMVIEKNGAPFIPELLNSIEKQSNYTKNIDMAINLGIYGADMSYASIHNQSQYTIDYMKASMNLADQLGIIDAITKDDLQILSDSMNNSNAILNIISRTFLKSNSYLDENGRPEITALIITGGWIEGIYIGSQIALSTHNAGLTQDIIDQQLVIDDLIGLLQIHAEDENIKTILVDIKKIKKASGEVNITQNNDSFQFFCDLIASTRNNYVEN